MHLVRLVARSLVAIGVIAGCAAPSNSVPDPAKGPHIVSLKVPTIKVAPAMTFDFAVTAESPDASSLQYLWTVSGGDLSDPYAQAPTWRAPTPAFGQDATIQVQVRVRDAKGREDQRAAQVWVSSSP